MSNTQLSLEHLYRAPVTETPNAPAIIMLHGFGSDENDLFSFATELPEHYHIISLKAPLPMQPYGNAWYNIYFDANDGKFSDIPQAIASRDLVAKCIDEIVDVYPIDPTQITLLGFSQGTILSFAIGLNYPEKVNRIIGLSGYINEELLKEGYEQHDFSRLKVYSSHGTVDQVLPIEWARKTAPFLKELDIPCEYSEFLVGHGVAPQNFYEFKKWLLENEDESIRVQ